MKRILLFIFIAVLSFASIPLAPPPVNAQTEDCDKPIYSSQDIAFFNLCENTCSAGGTSEGVVTTLTGADNRAKIMNYLQTRGLSLEQAAGLASNFKEEGGFSAFRQEIGKAWPTGGYGIAQFTGEQRVAVTRFLQEAVGSALYATYYTAAFGGSVQAENGYIPTGVPVDVNDKFLLAELDYVYQYVSGFAPSTIATRVTQLKADHGLTIDSGVKLLDYIKSLESEGDVAKAWTYLYEYPGNIKATSIDRATNATAIVAEFKGTEAASCGIGAGGMDFKQASSFMQAYHTDKKDYFTNELRNTFWAQPGQVNQCTAFVMFFVNKHVAPLNNTLNGRDTANYVASQQPGYYTSVTKDKITPFTIFSVVDDGPGHTGVILGVLADGSVIIGESNSEPGFGPDDGLIETTIIGVKGPDPGIASVSHWESVDKWLQAWSSWGYNEPTFAAPVQPGLIKIN